MTQSPGQVTQGKLLLARLAVLQERFAQASVAYEAVIRENPLEGDAILALADLKERAGEVEEARILLERAARIDGFEARALVRHAQLEVGQGNYGRAVPLLERAQVFTNRPTVRRYLEQVRRLASH
jgi:Flp pilus assembly protein TadD